MQSRLLDGIEGHIAHIHSRGGQPILLGSVACRQGPSARLKRSWFPQQRAPSTPQLT